MFNPLMHNMRTVFVDSDGEMATKSCLEIMSMLVRDVNVVLRLRSGDDWIFASPNYWNQSDGVLWFSYVEGTSQAALVGINTDAEIVHYTDGE